ncbi:hypothetical protein LUZ63_016947 [Rhynchospora breviuscula]|uniref:CCHC-type domain-containing protein n=1 Tax=Rhynchospora breviuscula TaxID=2022672 RepID=A0A9Q0HEW0_9POAL|nr:hypothetical protein LUZ63_016947 [Rhynchospora breviuscula]
MESRPSVSNRDEQSREQTPTIEDQIRGYRLGHRARHELNRRLHLRPRGYQRTLESQLNPEAELNISQFRRVQTVPAEILYQAGGLFTTQHQVYQHYSDQRISVAGSQQLELPFITQQSFEELQRSGLQHLHIGLIMIRLFTLHRRAAGVNALVVFRDTRWSDDRSIIGTMEIDLTHDTQLAYIAPNIMLSIRDFFNHIQLVIQTHGYDTWQAGESNLLLTRSLIGRLSNTSYTGFRYNVSNVSDYLASRGVQAIPGQRYSTTELRGRQWIIRPSQQPEIQHPQEAVSQTRTDGSILLRFKNYAATPTPQGPSVGPNDEEQLSEKETAFMFWVEDDNDEPEDDTEIFWETLEIMAQPAVIQDYGPVWDTNDKDDEDWINPFAKDGGIYTEPETHAETETETETKASTTAQINNHETVLMMELEYPKLKQFLEEIPVQEKAFSSVTSNYRPPPEPVMGPVTYPPGRLRTDVGASSSQFQGIRPRGLPGGIGRHQNEQWNLPIASQTQGAMLVLPEDIGLYNDTISRWESITLNLLSEKNFDDNKAKVVYIENLLGEIEKKIWIQWRTEFSTEYEQLVAIADDTQNVISQLEDPYQGTTEEQDRAYNDLERLSCENIKDLFLYMNDFKVLAAKSGRMYISSELSEKFFRKMPPLIGKELEQAFQAKFPNNTTGVMPRIHFSYQYLAEMCKKAALQRSLKDLTICSKIPIPGDYYRSNRKKYGLRKAKTYKGKPHDSHVRVFKRKHSDRIRKCKCFICGEEGHFARNCTRSQGNIARAAILENLDLPDDLDIVSVDLNEPDSDAICSLSEGESGNTEHHVRACLEELPYEGAFMLNITNYGWRCKIKLPQEQEICEHQFTEESSFTGPCSFCKENSNHKIGCERCGLTACPLCSNFYLGKPIKPKTQPRKYQNKDSLIKELFKYIEHLETEIERLTEELKILTGENLLKDLSKDFEELTISKGKEKVENESEDIHVMFTENPSHLIEEGQYKAEEITRPGQRKIINRLYNLVVLFEIPNLKPFEIRAILDTGATNCSICQTAVPEEALEDSPYPVHITGVNSRQIATKKLKGGQMTIGENKFRIPFTYSFPMGMRDGIQMLIGCNFIRSMQGGLRIEGNIITFYKNVTVVQTSTETVANTVAIEELGLEEIEYLTIQDSVYYQNQIHNKNFENRFATLLTKLKEQGFIGDNPL